MILCRRILCRAALLLALALTVITAISTTVHAQGPDQIPGNPPTDSSSGARTRA